jgi:hypothetical protein
MFMNLGDVSVNSTLYCPFSTYNSSGASVTITGLVVTDIEIYKDGSVTQRASDNGYTLLDTDGIDFDGITGIHGFSVDLSDNTTAGFYAAGSTYWIVVSAITVDSQTVNFGYYFTIDKHNIFRPTLPVGAIPSLGIIDNGTAQSATATTLVLRSAAAFADDTVNGAILMVFGSTQGYWQTRAVTDSVLSTDTLTVDTWTVTPSGTITYILYAGSPASATLIPNVNVTQISGDSTAADNAEAFFDGTGYAGTNNVIPTVTSVTAVATGGITAGSIAADAIGASELAADAVTEIQSGLATASALSTVAGYLDTEIAAILALLDDPRTEPGQGTPPVNPDLATKIDYLYKAWRNRSTQTATQYSVYGDDATTIHHKATASDDGTTFDRGEIATGP